jgi:hypothetical protein
MVAGHQGMKFSFFITFAHVDRTRFQEATTAQTQTLAAIPRISETEINFQS